MKEKVRIAAVQMDIKGMDPSANLDHMCDLIEEVTARGPTDLIVFPELVNSGYINSMDLEFSKEYFQLAEKIPGDFTMALGKEAKRHGIFVIAGILQAHPLIPMVLFNSAVLIDPEGEIVGVQKKMHLPGEEKHYFCPGSNVHVFNTKLGKIGITVCADGSFPEVPRMLALKGAEIICGCYNVPKLSGKEFMYERIRHIGACRAIENMCFFIGCNRVGKDAGGAYMGHSAIAGPMGQLLACSELDKEDVLRAELTDEMLMEARLTFGYFSMRSPMSYSIISEAVS